MRRLTTLLVISTLVLSACSGWRDSRVNPSNWFGKSRSAPAPQATAANPNPLIPEQVGIFRRDKRAVYEGTLLDEVTDVVVERTSTGAIVRVTGQSRLQGAHDVRLTSETDGKPVDGVLSFSLKAIQPQNQGVGTREGRTVRVGRYISRQVLEETSTIRIVAERNVRTTRRR
ncbi:hypothetical protein EI983_08415 [Roseovarius faecimaris]|uniref:Uncharacterized protein n=1 Tax=Roseovarius faecimaris TaxID=2494550 RepID=A0A6I6IR12_9RHOB|nr:hypothetical protein [Roseovarius faecimaris]QGX98303.1 hypothetical protein EI983_08415 [Roseovarius faecimaris]